MLINGAQGNMFTVSINQTTQRQSDYDNRLDGMDELCKYRKTKEKIVQIVQTHLHLNRLHFTVLLSEGTLLKWTQGD